jgi:hypothetical protein
MDSQPSYHITSSCLTFDNFNTTIKELTAKMWSKTLSRQFFDKETYLKVHLSPIRDPQRYIYIQCREQEEVVGFALIEKNYLLGRLAWGWVPDCKEIYSLY